MKKGSSSDDELRPDYKRSDFGELVRGKYFERLKKGANVVVLEPELDRAIAEKDPEGLPRSGQ